MAFLHVLLLITLARALSSLILIKNEENFVANIIIDKDGLAHLPGGAQIGHETLCGNVDTCTVYNYDKGTPTCKACISAAKDLLKQCTLKEIKSW